MSLENSILLLDKYRDYLKQNRTTGNPIDLVDFAQWIIQSNVKSKISSVEQLDANNIEEEISRLLVLMYRYAKVHLKTYLLDYPELVQEDFTYIYALKRYEKLTKTQLIELNSHEKTTGLEIIRRLIQNNIFQETLHAYDKRSKELKLTEKGEQAFIHLKETTRKIAKLIAGKLNDDEKTQLFLILKKLDAFHQPLYLSKNRKSLDELLDSLEPN